MCADKHVLIAASEVASRLRDLFASPAAKKFMVLGRPFSKIASPPFILGSESASAHARLSKYRCTNTVAGAEALKTPLAPSAASPTPATKALFLPNIGPNPSTPTPATAVLSSDSASRDVPVKSAYVQEHDINMALLTDVDPLPRLSTPKAQPGHGTGDEDA